ncbi:MAG: hypothetical protein FWD58_08815 [Firmicutes bacterium]|nr:hypothetical protein [Bacillota bacterium]
MNLQEIKKQARLYERLKDNQAPPGEYFFAFTQEKFDESEKKIHAVSQEQIYKRPHGLFGTRKGLDEFDAHFEGVIKSIEQQCTPLGIFYSEYHNHEGDYGDDEAWELTSDYFPDFDFNSKENAAAVRAIIADWRKKCCG